jgi:Domain of unknown function (DUF222)
MADVVSPQGQSEPASRARPARQPGAGVPASWLDTIGARQTCPPDAVPEAIEAGFARDPDDAYPIRGRAGFEACGPADLMAPCSVLAELTGQARDRMSELTDDELVGVLRATRRVQSWQAALELEAVSELAARRLAEPVRPGPRPADRLAAELAAALTLTIRSADSLVHVATSVERLGGLRDALAGGQIDLSRARVFADELCVLDWLKATRIAAKLVLEAPGLTTAQLQARLRRAVLAADPEAGCRRQKAAKDNARVETWQESSGNGALAGRELPPAGVLAADRHLTALAKARRQPARRARWISSGVRSTSRCCPARILPSCCPGGQATPVPRASGRVATPGRVPRALGVTTPGRVPQGLRVTAEPRAPARQWPAQTDRPKPARNLLARRCPGQLGPSARSTSPCPCQPGSDRPATRARLRDTDLSMHGPAATSPDSSPACPAPGAA